jgi:hypothetical protein
MVGKVSIGLECIDDGFSHSLGFITDRVLGTLAI